MPRLFAILLLAAIASLLTSHGQEADDTDIRLSPELEPSPKTNRLVNSRNYPFLNLAADTLIMNGADWSALAQLMRNSGDTIVHIVHIGDSHIQAEGSTSVLRSCFQNHYGSAGRGLITPFRIAGTNQPVDYQITSPSRFTTAKLLKQPWPVDMGFTGISVSPTEQRYSITLSTSSVDGAEQDFTIVRIFITGKFPKIAKLTDEQGRNAAFSILDSEGTLSIFIHEPVTAATIHFVSTGKCAIHGFMLENQMTGVLYSAIGNNGATYSSYNSIGSFAADLRPLSPHLFIISLGTNEAFGTTSADMLYQNIEMLVTSLRAQHPGAQFLLTTPAECQRSKWVRTGKGKRRKRTRSYSVNANVAKMRTAILKYGADHSIPVFDFYAVAGGAGSSDKWIKAELMRSDRIHYSWDGYALIGRLLFDAMRQRL